MVVTIGSSDSNVKDANVPAGYSCPSVVSKSNWAGTETYGDTFKITQSGTTLSAKRMDNGGGWGMNLRITCTSAGVGFSLLRAPASHS